MNYEYITIEARGSVTLLTINRPQKMNALSSKVLEEIGRAVDAFLATPATGAMIVTGAGEKAFVAGADIEELSGLDAAGGKAFSEYGQGIFDRIENSPKPIIAAINGFTFGGGCELALACHIRIGATTAKFGQPEVNLGLIPGAGGTQRLPRVVGRAHATYLILTGEAISAEDALRIGLISKLVEPAALIETAMKVAETILSKGPVAVRYALEAIHRGTEMAQPEAMGLEAALFGLCFATQDMKEGTGAFKEKRKAVFKGK
jgi:enoyl-CoA hydratase